MNLRQCLTIIAMMVALGATGQVHLTPIVGINSTRLKLGEDYSKGGNFLFGGVEFEGRLKARKIRSTHLSLMTGVTYLPNGFHRNAQFSFPGVGFFDSNVLDITTQNLQVPLMLKFNWQMFPLVEDFILSIGAGASSNFLMKATLSESATRIIFSTDIFAPPQTVHYEDSRDVTDLARKQSFFYRFDLGLRFRRLQVAFRLSIAAQDMYFEGLENMWQVPPSDSDYVRPHSEGQSIGEKYSEFAIGYRLF